MAGTVNKLNVTALLTGFPGSANTNICLVCVEPRLRDSSVANVAGLPGFIRTCNMELEHQPW